MIDPAIEARILANLRAGDERVRESALDELFQLVGRPLFQVCLRVACDTTDAEDAVQETFVDVLKGLSAFRADARLSTWMFRIAIRAALRVRSRRHRKEQRESNRFDEADLGAADLASLAGDAQDPGAIALQREDAACVLTAIQKLSAPQRTVLGLAALEEMPQAEIAAILGVPVGTVYSRLSAARERLREILDASPNSARAPVRVAPGAKSA